MLPSFERLKSADLGSPPRRVPGAHAIAAFGIVLPSLLGGAALAVSQLPPQVLPVAGKVAVVTVLAIALAAVLVRGARRIRLLRDGVASRAELIKTKSAGTLEASSLRCASGWDVKSYSYRGTAYRNVLRLWGEHGDSATFTDNLLLGGSRYEGEIFVLDPRKPARHFGVRSFCIPLRPDTRGQWKVWPGAMRQLWARSVLAVVLLAAGAVGPGLVWSRDLVTSVRGADYVAQPQTDGVHAR